MTKVLNERQERLWKQIKAWKQRIMELQDELWSEDLKQWQVRHLNDQILDLHRLIDDGLIELFKD